ncbi:alcohol dehydrogenase GroES-like domain-containing protein [Hypomontagnella monticulosa]|nr:alcohol dehydrogenase GroES-like domain-containing protein [Hypomontagnella monticulosa]
MTIAQMRGLVGAGSGQYRLASDLDIPSLRPGSLLVHVHAVALNPSDAKKADYSNIEGSTTGHDFAGTVVRVSEDVKARFKEGDRILAVAYGMNAENLRRGAFSDYALATADVACKMPEGMSFEEACAMPSALATAGLTLFSELRLPLPGTPEASSMSGTLVLVSGGASATGTMAIQLLKRAGLTPIVTCSPENNALCESFGATACFDYHQPTCGTDIRTYTNDKLAYVLDCATDATTMSMCYESLGSSGGRYVALEAFSTTVQYTRRDVVASWIMVLSMFGEAVKLPGAYGRPISNEDKEFSGRFFEMMESMLEQRAIKNHPIEVREGGLGTLVEGIQEVRLGRVRAKKLVYPLIGEVF